MPMENPRKCAERLGHLLVDWFLVAALFVLGASIVWAAVAEYLRMMAAGRAGLEDILLLFIYVELGAMVGIYFKTDRLPVMFLIYVAITAITRFLVIDMKELTPDNVLVFSGAILVLTVAALVIHFASSKFPMGDEPKVTEQH
jgi:protein PsiE